MRKTVVIAALCLLLFVSMGILWARLSEYVVTKMEGWENAGVVHVMTINQALSSGLSWEAKTRALRATEKILDDSSIPVLIGQLSYEGHFWRRWDYEEVNKAAVYREQVMYVLSSYRDRALGPLMKELSKRPLDDCREVILSIGLLQTSRSQLELQRLASDPRHKNQAQTIRQALLLREEGQAKSVPPTIPRERTYKGIEELESALGRRLSISEEVHLAAVIQDLGILRVRESRLLLRRIIEGKPSEQLVLEAIGALGRIGDQRDVAFLSRLVRDVDIDVRRESIVSLGNIRSQEARPALKTVVEDSREAPKNRQLGKEALSHIRSPR